MNQQEDEYDESAAVDTAWKIHGALADWTGKVDAKASFALAVESAAIIASITLSTQGRLFETFAAGWQVVAFWLALGILLVAAGLAIVAVVPRLRRARVEAEWRTNFIYFGHLKYWSKDDLVATLRNQPVLPVLASQLINMSSIAWRKHRLVQISLILAALAVAILLILAATA